MTDSLFGKVVPVPQIPSKSLRKRIGAELRDIDQQAKRMHKLLLQTMEEGFFAKRPLGNTRKGIRRLLCWLNGALEQKLYQDALELRRKVLGSVAENMQLAGPC
jgi:hypothetical protein